MVIQKPQWFKTAFQIKGSVITAIYQRVILTGAFGVLVSVLYYSKVPVSQPILASVIPSIVLGLLLVFRTNTAYERFWEGRKCWGSMVNTIRNLARQIWVCIDEKQPEDKDNKIDALNLLAAFGIATKLHLRSEPINSDLEALIPESKYHIKDY